jgi:hypothetical protein
MKIVRAGEGLLIASDRVRRSRSVDGGGRRRRLTIAQANTTKRVFSAIVCRAKLAEPPTRWPTPYLGRIEEARAHAAMFGLTTIFRPRCSVEQASVRFVKRGPMEKASAESWKFRNVDIRVEKAAPSSKGAVFDDFVVRASDGLNRGHAFAIPCCRLSSLVTKRKSQCHHPKIP